jgi:cation diffusion facilitator family transporter
MHHNFKLAWGTLGIGLTTLVIKYTAYFMTGSIALYADAIESIINVVAAMMMVLAISLSHKPADDSHHYGHQKIEYLSALLESVFILIAAIFILLEAVHAYQIPRVLDAPVIGLIISGLATLLNGAWGLLLTSYGKKNHSPALFADGIHLLMDVFSSFCITVGLIISIVTHFALLDVIIAFFVGVHLIWSGFGLAKNAIDGLMDAAPSIEECHKIYELIINDDEKKLTIHDLKIRRSGKILFIDFHLVVATDTLVRDGQVLCNKIEALLEQHYPESVISIHLEAQPCGKK